METERSKSLTELEGDDWGDPAEDASYLISRCHKLRYKPVGEMTVEDLRVLIGQEIGVRWLVPIAMEVLQRDPCAQGHMYSGDLLATVARVPEEYWAEHADLKAGLAAIRERVEVMGGCG